MGDKKNKKRENMLHWGACGFTGGKEGTGSKRGKKEKKV